MMDRMKKGSIIARENFCCKSIMSSYFGYRVLTSVMKDSATTSLTSNSIYMWKCKKYKLDSGNTEVNG